MEKLDLSEFNFRNEEEFLDHLYLKLEKFLKANHRNVLLKKKIKTARKPRDLEPDIIIGFNEILIELKLNPKLNDIYRLFYQAVRYPKISKNTKSLILFLLVKETRNKNATKLKKEEIMDLKSFPKVRVIQKIYNN